MNERLPIQTYQAELIEQLTAPQPIVIGLEGGPCSGKTTLTNEIASRAESLERPVVTLPEAATEHIEQVVASGRTIPEVAERDRPAYLDFQRGVLGTIIHNIQEAQKEYAGRDAIILVDRPDIGAYVSRAEYQQLLAEQGMDRPPIHDMVDRLIFLPSVASEQPERYAELRGGNAARYEIFPEEAAAVCAANLQAVQTHPELEVAWGGLFEAKIRHLAAVVLQPEIEGGIKFGVEYKEAEMFRYLAGLHGHTLNVMEIRQSYHEYNGQEFRLRASSGNDDTDNYFFTIKLGEGAFRTELQRRITLGEYGILRATPRIGKELHKRRHVILDTLDTDAKRRLWFADEYVSPRLPEWHFETAVADEDEFEVLATRYAATRRVITESAKALIFK